ncbi:hypothetical protein Clacol_001396 [Clathrus columnatus]|uniref:Uncharacterized protein n=1 Tax=Clathrus columnatus TaxID=1419009 RepID=A0AAV5A2F0_9AGAM|nr:hypothetical protein Clacol_001396 [Clathrus columnatus]
MHTPILDFDEKSPLPCIIVTPSTPTEYHIAFHPKDSPLQQLSFAAQQQKRQQPRARRAFLASLSSFVDPPPAVHQALETPFRRYPSKQSSRLAFLIGIPIFIIICHFLLTAFMRNVGLGSPLFTGPLSRGGLTSNVVHFRAHRDGIAEPEPAPLASSITSIEDVLIDLNAN